jgi:hypothetical protein
VPPSSGRNITMMEASSTSETLVNFYWITWHYNSGLNFVDDGGVAESKLGF